MGKQLSFVISVLSGLVGVVLALLIAGPASSSGRSLGWPCFAAWATSFASLVAGMIFIALERISESLDRIAENGELFNRRYGVASAEVQQPKRGSWS